MTQEYPGVKDEQRHFDELRSAFEDDRYLRVDGKPIFAIFSPSELPSVTEFIDRWREFAHRGGLRGIYLVALTNDCNNFSFDSFDAVTPHPPHDFLDKVRNSALLKICRKIKNRDFGSEVIAKLIGRTSEKVLNRDFDPNVINRFMASHRFPDRYPYSEVVRRAFDELPDSSKVHPCVLPNWDNTPRSGSSGVVFENSTPELFRQYLIKAIDRVSDRRREERIVFLKAWNEWGEGNYVEPDSRFSHQYLDVIREEMFP